MAASKTETTLTWLAVLGVTVYLFASVTGGFRANPTDADEERFERAFKDLDDGYNQVAISDMIAHTGMPRGEFLALFKQLRRERRYSAGTFDGRHGTLDQDVRDAGFTEMGRHYVYVAKHKQYG